MNCDGCTLCCKLLPVAWMDSPAGRYCKECDPGVGCKIYDTAPEDCLKFRCAYNQMEKASINLRPDKCDVVFEKISDDVFIGTVDASVKQLNKYANGQIESFLNQGFSVVLFHQNIKTPFIYPAQGKTPDEVCDAIEKKRAKINGCSNI